LLEENADLEDHRNDFVGIHSTKFGITTQAKSARRIQADGGGGGVYAAMLVRRRLRRSQRRAVVGTPTVPD
jgi:hypothetical protein